MRPKPPVAKSTALAAKMCSRPVASSTATTPLQTLFVQEHVHDLEFVEKGDLVLDALLVEGLQDHVPGAVGGVAGAADRRFAEVARMTAESALVDAPLRGPVEGQAAVFQIVDGLDGLFGQDLGRLLVDQIIAAFDRVEGVPLGFVLLHIAQGRADAPLGRAGMAANGIEFGENRGVRLLAGFQGGIEAGAAGADDHGVKLMNHRHLSLVGIGLCRRHTTRQWLGSGSTSRSAVNRTCRATLAALTLKKLGKWRRESAGCPREPGRPSAGRSWQAADRLLCCRPLGSVETSVFLIRVSQRERRIALCRHKPGPARKTLSASAAARSALPGPGTVLTGEMFFPIGHFVEAALVPVRQNLPRSRPIRFIGGRGTL